MLYKFTVDIPSADGKIIITKRKNVSYVMYTYRQDYVKDKGYSLPRRAVIGRVAKEPGKMYPNEKFEEYFPNIALPEELPETDRSCSLRIGSYAVIKNVMEEYKLPDLLYKRFGEKTGLLLDLVSYLIVDEDNAGQYYPDYAYSHPLFSQDMNIYSDSTVSRFLKSVTENQTLGFLDDWNEGRDKRQRIYISYDSTNKFCQAGDIEMVEFSKAKDGRKLPVFNVSVAYDKTNKVPILYEEYPGSIVDVSQLSFLIEKVNDYGYKNVGFILDRGYFSKENIQYMDANGYSFIVMCKGCKALVSSLVMGHRNTFETDRSCLIRQYRAYGTTFQAKMYADDEKERYFHIFYNPSRQAAEREKLEGTIEKFRSFLEKQIGSANTFGDTYKKYFELTYAKDNTLAGVKEKSDVVQKELELCGYFCIITSEEMTAEKALILYKSRDVSEKLFRSDKSFIGSKSMRVQTNEAMSAKIFVEFIALIVRNRMYCLLRNTMMRMEKRSNFLTVPAAIRELEKIEMVRRTGKTYKLDHAVTKNQKTILSSFGMDENSIRTTANEIGKALAESKDSQKNETEDKEDGEEEIDSLD